MMWDKKWWTYGGFTVLSALCIALIVVLVSRQCIPIYANGDPEQQPFGSQPPPEVFPWSQNRLPDYIVPLSYDILLHPDLVNGSFEGETKIVIKLDETTDYLWFHAKNLHLVHVTVYAGEEITETMIAPAKSHFSYSENDYHVINFEESILPGNYTLKFVFRGSLLTKSEGFYRLEYRDGLEHARYIAASKFSPTSARRAYPCFDEPRFKATFIIRLVHLPNMTALSNMDIDDISVYDAGKNLMISSFRRTPLMSTYLTTFMITQFNYTSGQLEDKKPFKVWSRPEVVNLTNFALNFGIRVQDEFTRYFNIGFPIPKQDMVAVPDYVYNAMEHWGCITFREKNLLYGPGITTSKENESAAKVIAHEIAHQWFGNLVTMSWWSDVWLKEGFAEFFGFLGLQRVLPEWNLDGAVIEYTQMALRSDHIKTYPIVDKTADAASMWDVFDPLTYNKGLALINMMQNFMGKEALKRGAQAFLQKHAFSNVTTDDLWDVLGTEIQTINLKNVMSTWTLQMGYPVVNVERTILNGSCRFSITQKRFTSDPNTLYNKTESPYKYYWQIPLTYMTSANSKVYLLWMNAANQRLSFTVDGLGPEDWIKINVRQTGYYRVNYEEEQWRLFADVLHKNHLTLTETDRANLIDDAFNLASSGLLMYSTAFELSSYISKERSYLPWSSFLVNFNKILLASSASEMYGYLQHYLAILLRPIYLDNVWEDTGDHLTRKLKSTIIDFACEFSVPEYMATASDKLISWLTNDTFVPPNQLQATLKAGVKVLGGGIWEELWAKYDNNFESHRKSDYVSGLSATTETWRMAKLVAAVSENKANKPEEFVLVITKLANYPTGRDFVWKYIRENWTELSSTPTLKSYMTKMLKIITATFSTQIDLRELEEFFERHSDATSVRQKQRILENVNVNVRWWNRSQRSIRDWVEMHLSVNVKQEQELRS